MEEDVDLMYFSWFDIELVEEKSQNIFFLELIPKLEGGTSDAFKVIFRLTKNDCLNILKEIEEYEDDFRDKNKICNVEEGADYSDGDEPDPHMELTLDDEKSNCTLTFLNKKELKQFANLITEELKIEIEEDFSS